MNENTKLKRGLKSRHVTMIAIGGAIGTGLFLGSGSAIHSAGPSIILSYLIVGIITFICAPLALIARHKLAKRQKRGPLFFNIYLAVLGIRNNVYACIAIVIFKKIDLDFGGKLFSVKANIAGMVGLIVIFLICMCYYHNRKEYFVN